MMRAGFRLRPRHHRSTPQVDLLLRDLLRQKWCAQPSSSRIRYRIVKVPTHYCGKGITNYSNHYKNWDGRDEAYRVARVIEGVTKWEANKNVMAFPSYVWSFEGAAQGGQLMLTEAIEQLRSMQYNKEKGTMAGFAVRI